VSKRQQIGNYINQRVAENRQRIENARQRDEREAVILREMAKQKAEEQK